MSEGNRGRPTLSFLCTAYRTEHVVSRMVESVLAQTRDDWELIVVDNGRSDEMARIIGTYTHDPRVRLIRQENRGIVGGINAAGRQANGRYVAILNSDDAVLPRYTERLLGLLESRSDVDAVIPDARMVLQPHGIPLVDSHARDKARLRDPRPITTAEFVSGLVPYYSGPVKRELWEAVGGLREVGGPEDLQLWVDVVAHGGRVVLVDEQLAVCSIDESSASQDVSTAEVRERAREQMFVEAVERSGTSEDQAALGEAVRTCRHRLATMRAKRHLIGGDFGSARTEARHALSYSRDPRSLAIFVAISATPRVLLTLHRYRQHFVVSWARLRHRLDRRRSASAGFSSASCEEFPGGARSVFRATAGR